jgi:hypothetical protein
MENTSHWDFAESFSGRDAACLIGGFDPSIYSAENEYNIQPIIVRMKKSYYGTVKQMVDEITDGAGFHADDTNKDFAAINSMRNRTPNCDAYFHSSVELWSVEIDRMIRDYNCEYSASDIPTDFEFTYADRGTLPASEVKRRIHKWLFDASEEGDKYYKIEQKIRSELLNWTYEQVHEFGDQRFSRGELHRWISKNNFKSEYQFVTMEVAPPFVEKPLSTTERNTLLTIIAALCDYSDIKHQGRGAAVQVAKMTAEMGAPVTDDTVRDVLAKIPNAVESRMK